MSYNARKISPEVDIMKLRNGLVWVALLIAAVLLLPGCSQDAEEDVPEGIQTPNVLDVDMEGNSSIDPVALEAAWEPETVQGMTDEESAGIAYMREEEKLARDVYHYLYEKWGTNTFNNIGNSEQTHMDAVASLLDRYGLADPAADTDYGEFTDAALQALYDQLVAQGDKSEVEALKVGAAIEEIDIIDLKEYMWHTDNADIITVYENLMKGSRNHLRSFVSVLEKRGVTYEPQYLSEGEYSGIILEEIEKGHQ